MGWGHWYTLRELEEATNGLADENVIGSGGYGIVYHGILQDGSQIAVKNLLNNKYWSFFSIFLLMFDLFCMFYAQRKKKIRVSFFEFQLIDILICGFEC